MDWQCTRCDITGTKEEVIRHHLKNHVRGPDIPFACRMGQCDFMTHARGLAWAHVKNNHQAARHDQVEDYMIGTCKDVGAETYVRLKEVLRKECITETYNGGRVSDRNRIVRSKVVSSMQPRVDMGKRVGDDEARKRRDEGPSGSRKGRDRQEDEEENGSHKARKRQREMMMIAMIMPPSVPLQRRGRAAAPRRNHLLRKNQRSVPLRRK